MAIHNEEVQEMTSGLNKQIEASAMNLIMENLQRYQYQYPIKSTVRELVCNGLDSVADRNVAKDILINGAPVSKYFVEREGDMFKDSKFDPSYYDPKWLSDDNNVYITYREGVGLEKSELIIEDYGTGLGGKRLAGYFNLGFSTKRLSKLPLGKFGIGAKSALSVGVKFYTMESRYNGMLFRFNIYSSKVDSIIPRFNLETGQENPYIDMGSNQLVANDQGVLEEKWVPYHVYYEPTTEKNGVRINIETKKHHKSSYIDAVKTQLLYFDNVRFTVEHDNGHQEVIRHQAGIIYEDDYIVLSDNRVWSKPHLLLNRVNYGYIDFDELELEVKHGNIGIKVDPEDVEVNPSREAVIWSEQTKEMIGKRFKDVVGIATRMVQKELQETDFLKWMKTCAQLSGSSFNSSTVVGRLANIVELNDLELQYPPLPAITYLPRTIARCFHIREYSFKESKKAGINTRKVKRDLIKAFGPYTHLPIFLLDERTSVRRDKYLLQKIYPEGFLTLRIPELPEGLDAAGVTLDNLAQLLPGVAEMDLTVITAKELKLYKTLLGQMATLKENLLASPELLRYSSIIVPDDFKASDNDEEEILDTEEDQEASQENQMSREERRKLEGKTVLFTPRFDPYNRKSSSDKYFVWDKQEVPIAAINNWSNEEVFYGCDADGETIHMAAFLSREPSEELPYGSRLWHWKDDAPVRIVKVAQDNTRMYRDFKHISKFFVDVRNGTLNMSNALTRWNTARLIGKQLNRMAFLYNFDEFNPEQATAFRKLVDYVRENYREIEPYTTTKYGVTDEAYKALLKYLQNVQAFQEFVQSEPGDEQVSAMATQIFGSGGPHIKNAVAVDPEIWAQFNLLKEYAEPIAPLLNEIPALTGLPDFHEISSTLYDVTEDDHVADIDKYLQFINRTKVKIPEQTEQAIREYLNWKGVS